MSETQPTSPPSPASPRWGGMTKLVVALTGIVILGALIVRFNVIIMPLVMAFMLAYLLHPLASLLDRKAHMSWRMAVNLIYLVLLIVLIAILTLGGIGLVQQIQNLIGTIQETITNLPGFFENLSHTVYKLGPLVIDFSTIDWQSIGQQALSYVQPALGKLGTLVGSLASGAASTLGWLAFIFLVSYFILAESGGLRSGILRFELPGYADDFRRLGAELGRIWNAFLRGQMIIFLSKVIFYTFLLSLLGVHYSIGLALVAGFAGFLPYVGPMINWIALGLVTFFQGSTIFGLSPLGYMLLVIALALVIDQIYDSLVAPRIMAQKLKVHPAAVLVAAIIAASLLGVIGVFIAAPLLATLQLIGTYAMRKMFDKDPWPEEQAAPPRRKVSLFSRLRSLLRKWFKRNPARK
jgi:predicted PurR-regulated permease PerM